MGCGFKEESAIQLQEMLLVDSLQLPKLGDPLQLFFFLRGGEWGVGQGERENLNQAHTQHGA